MERKLYMIALLPPVELTDRIREIQHEIERKYYSRESLSRPVHITLIPPFRKSESELNQMVNVLKEHISTEEPFLIRLDGFGFFEKNRVVFIEINPAKQLISFREDLYQVLAEESAFYLDSRDQKFHPHITVGYRDLGINSFEEARSEFSEREFSGVWETEEVDLLVHEGSWKSIRKFGFS